jgi:hypothetical protein
MPTESDTYRKFVVPLLQEAVDTRRRLQAETATKLDTLLSAVLHKAFQEKL